MRKAQMRRCVICEEHQEPLPCNGVNHPQGCTSVIGLRQVSVLLPLREQPQLVRGPIGAGRWHGRWIASVWRKCFKHFVSVVRIRHESVIVQVYAVRLHVRNIDSAKQWPDITRERNLLRLLRFALLFCHAFSSICIVTYLVSAMKIAVITSVTRLELFQPLQENQGKKGEPVRAFV